MSSATPAVRKSAHRRVVRMGTTAVVGFALTLLVASLMVLMNKVPLHLPMLKRTELGAFLFCMPLLALTLALVVEVTRIAMRRTSLPEAVETRRIHWAEPATRD